MKTTFLILTIAAFVILPFCFWGERIDAWFTQMAHADTTTRGLLGSLLFAALALDIFLPVPSSLASTLCGSFFGSLGGFLISFGAMTTSCLIGWVVGTLFTPLARCFVGEKDLPHLQSLLARHGIIILLALRTVPVLAETSVLLAGIARVSFWKCMPILLLANALVSAVYVYAGAYGNQSENMLPAFLASIALSALLMLSTFYFRKSPKTNTSTF